MSDQQFSHPYLMMVAALTEAADAPILVPDLEATADEAYERRLKLEALGPTQLFLVLRELVSAGLVEQTAGGYQLTDDGAELATKLSKKKPREAEAMREAAEAVVAE